MSDFDDIKELLEDLQDDPSSPKTVKATIVDMIALMNQEKESTLKIDAMIEKLELLCEDINVPPFIRTQLWNILTVLENRSVELQQ